MRLDVVVSLYAVAKLAEKYYAHTMVVLFIMILRNTEGRNYKSKILRCIAAGHLVKQRQPKNPYQNSPTLLLLAAVACSPLGGRDGERKCRNSKQSIKKSVYLYN